VPVPRASRFVVRVAALAALVVACGDSGPPTSDAPPVGDVPSTEACPDGMRREGAVCLEIAAATCAPGSAPFAGEVECATVGPACPAEIFDRDPSGWGCVDRPAPAACAGATREEVGSARCVPLGDCAAPFPPAGAIVVDDDFADNQLDATHFRTIGAALAQAASGAVIAVEAGEYAESLAVTKPVSLVGRCPDRVTIRGGAARAGVRVSSVSGVTIRGLTLRGHERAVDAARGADVTVEEVYVVDSVAAGLFADASKLTVRRSKVEGTLPRSDGRWGWGLAGGAGSTVTAQEVAIVGGISGVFAASEGTTVALSESVIARQVPNGTAARANGLLSAMGARLELSRSVVRDLQGDGAVVGDSGTVEVRDSVLRDIRVNGSMARGHGAVAIAQGRVVLLDTTLVRAESIGLSSQGAGSRIEARNTVVRGPTESNAVVDNQLRVASERSGIGMQVVEGASGLIDGVVMLDAWGFATYVQEGGAFEAKRSYIDAVRPLRSREGLGFGVGVTVNGVGATAKLDRFTVTGGSLAALSAGKGGAIDGDHVLLRDVGEVAALGTGAGVSVGAGGKATLDRSAIVGAAGVGVLAVRGGGSSATLRRTVIRGTRVAQLGFGHALAIGFETSARVESSFIVENGATGMAIAGGSAVVSGVTFGSNPVAMHVQDGSFLVESDGDGALESGEVRVSPDTSFTNNGSRVGTGVVALPRAVLE
jgi:hypothetical protein